jgi:predicted nuclease of predicted toxin-antitoxin system
MPIIVADESVDYPIIESVRSAGWVVWSVSEECPSVADDIVLEIASEKAAILVTMDSDFGELVFERNQKPPLCVIFMRNKGLTLAKAIRLLHATLSLDDLSGRYVTLTRSSKRQRPLPEWNPSND